MRVLGTAALMSMVCLATAVSAAPLDPLEACTESRLDVPRYILAVRACSDAVFVREDVKEADAICWAAHVYHRSFADQLLELATLANDPASQVSTSGCFKRNVRPMMPAYLAAHEWWLRYNRVRIDGTGAASLQPLRVGDIPGEQ